jgi:non-canonical poly(A) RNA polymerase PAPD5/7
MDASVKGSNERSPTKQLEANSGENDEWQNDDYLSLDTKKEIFNNDNFDNSDMERSTSDETTLQEQQHWNPLLPPPWLEGSDRHNTINNDQTRGRVSQASTHPITTLHNEIVAFVHLIEPLPSEIEQREALVHRIRNTVRKNFPEGTRVEVFGSQATGLFLPTSDIDLVVISPSESSQVDTSNNLEEGKKSRNQRRRERRKTEELKDQMKDENEVETTLGDEDNTNQNDEEVNYTPAPKSPLHYFAQAMRQDWGVHELSYLELIENTRIPLVKFTHASTNISVDVSFDQPSGPPAAQLMKRYLEALPPLRPLTFVLKYFLAARCLNEPYTGGVGSFLLQLMIVAFLQHRERDAVNYQRPSVYNLGSLLLEFLELYGIEFNYFTTGISVRYDGFFFPKGAADRRSIFCKSDRMAMVSSLYNKNKEFRV